MVTKKAATKDAETKKVNKSQEIRTYKKANAEAGPTEIATALTKKGIEVSPSMVSNVLGKGTKKKKRGRKPKSAASAAAPTAAAANSSVDQLKAAAKLIAECGGVDEAAKALKGAGEIAKALG